MEISAIKVYFNALSFLAVVLLWGVSLWNGTVKALLLAVWHGALGDGPPLKTDYTGIIVIDYPIALLVAFFFYGTNAHDEAYQLFLLDAYSLLQSAFIWLYLESYRRQGKVGASWVKRPLAFGLLWQCLGGAISLPLYYAQHLPWALQDKLPHTHDVDHAKALPIGYLLGAIVPTLVGMAPTWLGPGARSAISHQTILAAWQPDPIWVSCIISLCASMFALFRGGSSGDSPRARSTAFAWARFSYLLAAILSGMAHIYVMGRVLLSTNPDVNFVRMYVPFLINGPEGTSSNIFVFGPWLFLQYDLIIMSLSSLSWVWILLRSLPGQSRPSSSILGLYFATGALVIGPGATVSSALFYREQFLSEQSGSTRGKGH
ncbi:hypothetical protein B0I35DRAFT_438021 [Stachybotrys elegans]|uniref:Uncharacterized protein n=1 Tax=Stachybotrys elegans TaxID=80388 RepID=A0A8K0SQM0_9HYPO|nr:hypothetical protein B0I35DRAFT_438021 [Stachybotrys elegans]